MVPVFWDTEGFINSQFIPKNKIKNQNAYWQWLWQLREKIHTKRNRYLPPSVVLQHEIQSHLAQVRSKDFIAVMSMRISASYTLQCCPCPVRLSFAWATEIILGVSPVPQKWGNEDGSSWMVVNARTQLLGQQNS